MISRACLNSSPANSRGGGRGRTRALPMPASSCTSLMSWTKCGTVIHAEQRQEPAGTVRTLFSFGRSCRNQKDQPIPRGKALAKPATHPVAPTPIASRIASSTPTSISRRWPSKARMGGNASDIGWLDSLTASKFACSRRQFAICSGRKSVPYATGLLYTCKQVAWPQTQRQYAPSFHASALVNIGVNTISPRQPQFHSAFAKVRPQQ